MRLFYLFFSRMHVKLDLTSGLGKNVQQYLDTPLHPGESPAPNIDDSSQSSGGASEDESSHSLNSDDSEDDKGGSDSE